VDVLFNDIRYCAAIHHQALGHLQSNRFDAISTDVMNRLVDLEFVVARESYA
jgi:hypothetical protein